MRMHRRYTPEEIRFVKKNIRGRAYIETLGMFNKRFGLRISLKQLETLTYKHGIRNGVGSFRPGHIPANKGKTHPSRKGNYRPVGSERLQCGYVFVKVTGGKNRGRKNWKAKHVAIWEKENGKVPKGRAVIFADGNNRNFDPDNLMPVSRAELAVMNRLGLISTDKRLTETGKIVADIKMLITKRKRAFKRKARKQTRAGSGPAKPRRGGVE